MRPTDKIKQSIKNVPVKTNPKVNQAVLDDLLNRLDAARGTPKHAPQPNIWRTMMNNRITKLSAAAAILIVGAVMLSQILSPGITFADVIKPIFEAQTFAFDMLVGEGGPVIHDRISGSRIRRTVSNMPDTVMIIDLKNNKMLTLDTDDQTAALIDITGPLAENTRNFIAFVREVITRLQSKPGFEPRPLPEREIDGRRVIGYSIGGGQESVTVWADPKTAAPVQIELGIGRHAFVMKNFEFNIPISEEELSMEPPAGYTLKEGTLDYANVNEEVFIQSLRVWAKYLHHGTFPPELSTQAYMTQVPMLEGVIGPLPVSDTEKELLGVYFVHGMLFLQKYELQQEGPWHYAGAGVKLGDAKTPIFWYRPKGSQTYRVIYGDLSVKDLAPEDLPK